MRQPINSLSADTLAIMQMVVDAVRNTLGNAPVQYEDLEETFVPEVYIAKAPADGIPGLGGIAPGSADCDLYQITVEAGQEALFQMEGLSRTVYNWGGDVAGGKFVLVARDKRGNWFVTSAAARIFPATLTDRALSDGEYTFAWTDNTWLDDGTIGVGSRSGTLPARVDIVQTQIADGLNPDIYTIDVVGATSATYKLIDAGTPTTDIAYNAAHATIEAALTHFTVAGTYPSFTATGTTGTTHTLTADVSLLKPSIGHYEARFDNRDVPRQVPVNVKLMQAAGAMPQGSFTEKTAPTDMDGQVLRLLFTGMRDGELTVTVDGGADITIQWDASAGDVQTAISAQLVCTVTGSDGDFDVTVTANLDSHVVTIDVSDLIGTAWFTVFADTNICTAPFGGVEMTLLASFPSAVAPTISVSPTGSSAGPWTITLANSASGTWQTVVDGGSPIDTNAGDTPVVAGFTVTVNPDGSFHLVAASGSHTLTVFGAKLRGPDVDCIPYLHDGCCVLGAVGDCIAGDV